MSRNEGDSLVDVVVVFHAERNHAQYLDLCNDLCCFETIPYQVIPVDNRVINRGFAAGCNLGAARATAPILGFLNPDVQIHGPVLGPVVDYLEANPDVAICGERFGKPHHEVRAWGCSDWVCGASMFMARSVFVQLGGFDEAFVWGFEETDLIRRAESRGLKVRSLELNLEHDSPDDDSPEDIAYKQHHFQLGAGRFAARWGVGR